MLSWIYLVVVEGVNFMNNFDKFMIKKKFEGFFFKICFFLYFIRLFIVKFFNKVCYVICGLFFCDYGFVYFGVLRGYIIFLIK